MEYTFGILPIPLELIWQIVHFQEYLSSLAVNWINFKVTTARFAVQLDFNANTFKWIGNDGRPGSFGPVYTEGTAPNFGAWSIDNTLKFYINSGVGGADSTNFKVQNMKVKFGTYTLSGFEAEESGVEG